MNRTYFFMDTPEVELYSIFNERYSYLLFMYVFYEVLQKSYKNNKSLLKNKREKKVLKNGALEKLKMQK